MSMRETIARDAFTAGGTDRFVIGPDQSLLRPAALGIVRPDGARPHAKA
ncbi:hypothetical protein [Verticiella sediminum]|nr:hypothetical protein [Verticiella sediminum]